MAVMALVPPPPGVTANFVNPEQGGKHVVVLGLVGIPISTLFLAMRLYTKARINRSFGSEDVSIFFAWFFSVAVQIITINSFLHKGGRHIWDTPLEQFASAQKIVLATSVLYVPALGLAKMSLLLIFRRISIMPKHRFVIHAVMMVVVGYSIALILVLIFQCNPIARAWDVTIVTGSCVNRPAVYVATACVNIVTDFAILILPVPIVIGLKLPLQQKIGLGWMFAVGSLTFVTSIIRLTTLWPLFTSIDQTWAIITPAMWIVIEANLLVICCCFISIKSFLRQHAPSLIGEKRTGYPSSTYYDTPRSKGLVITKDVSFNLSWQNEAAPRSHHSAGYIEMDQMQGTNARGTSDREPLNESQEIIIQPARAAPKA